MSHRVLYVNDNPADSETVRQALGANPDALQLVEARTRAEFEAYACQPGFAAVLVSIPVFDFNGTEVVERIHALASSTPIVLLAGVDAEWTALEAMKTGATGYILKQNAQIERLASFVHAAIDKGQVVEMKRQAERELDRSQVIFKSVLNALTSHIAVLDHEGGIVEVNEAWSRFAERNGPLDPADVGPGANYLDVCAKAAEEGDRQARMAVEGIQGILDSHYASFTMEYPCHSPDELRWFVLTATPVQLEQSGAVVAHTDITDRRIAEESLYQTRVQLDFALRALSIGYWEWNLETDEAYFSPEWKLQLGYNDNEAPNLRQTWEDLLHPDDRAEAIATVKGWAKQGHWGPLSTEYRLRHADRTYRRILCKASVQKNNSGRAVRMIGVHVDITPREPEA